MVVVAAALTGPGRALGARFFDALRIAKPAPVTAAAPTATGPGGNRALLEIASGMVAESVSASPDEPDRPAANARAAAALGGFAPALPAARRDAATFTILGALDVAVRVNRSRLATILREAGEPADLPPALDGAALRLHDPRRIRIQYGHCPAPLANTVQGQLQGPPPVTPENADCVVLVEGPVTSVAAPDSLPLPRLVTIALELSGMSPTQAQAFQKRLDWKTVLGVAIPRFLRSYDTVVVRGAPGILLNAAGRRGPSFELLWVRDSMVYTLAGYGSAADALPLAVSVGAAQERR
jgi:hypothetical protein